MKLSFLLFCVTSFSAFLHAQSPNVLIVMTDDQGYGDFGITGNTVVQTPNLDRFASEGTWLTDFHVSPLCAPTRAALLTGRYPLRSGVHGVTGGAENMDTEAITLAELFKAAGYRTGTFGKWHNGSSYPHHPNGQGFDEFVGFTAGHIGQYFNTMLQHNGEPYQSTGYIADVITDSAIDFIEAAPAKPFFCYVTLNTPHSPWQAPEALYQKYKALDLDDYHATCYAMIENIDMNFERLLEALDAEGLRDSTIVIFTTDNGPNGERYNAGYRDHKGRFYEGGTRVPLFIQWPAKLEPSRKLDALTAHLDLLPTLADWCNLDVSVTPPLDGIDLAPYITNGTNRPEDRMIFFHDNFGQTDKKAAVRTERWRAVRMDKDWELYDLRVDPSERVNVAKAFPEVIDNFSKAYDASFADVSQGLKDYPLVVGHPNRPDVYLAAHEASLVNPNHRAGIAYDGKHGWAHDWVANWKDSQANIQWPLESIDSGNYEVILEYSADQSQTGSKMTASFGDASTSKAITDSAVATRIKNPDTFDRKEADDLIWHTASLGTLEINEGQSGNFELSAQIPAGKEAPEVKGIYLKAIN